MEAIQFPFEYPQGPILEFQLTSSHQEDVKGKPFNYKSHSVYENGDNFVKKQGQYRYDFKQKRENWLQLYGRTRYAASVCVHIQIWICVVLELPSDFLDIARLQQFIKDQLQYDHYNIHFDFGYSHRLFDCHRSKSDPSKLDAYPFLHIWCKSQCVANKVTALFVNFKTKSNILVFGCKFKIVEQDISSILRFTQSCGIKPSGIVTVPFDQLTKLDKTNCLTHCQLEYECHVGHSKPPFECLDAIEIFPIRLLSYDIESPTVCKDDLPDREIPFCNAQKDPCICISSNVWDSFSNRKITISHTFGKHLPLEHKDHYSFCFATEVEMIEAWRDFVVYADVDWITGWNTDKFDWKYLYDRMMILNPLSRFFFWSRLITFECAKKESTFSSKQQGFIDKSTIEAPGRINFDLMIHWIKSFKHKIYSLGKIALEVLKHQSKLELSYGDLGRYARSNDPEKYRIIVDYCRRDSQLPIELFQTKQILESMVELSRITSVFIQDLYSRGQMYMNVALIFMQAKKRGFIMNHTSEASVGYKGASVLDVEEGYYPNPIAVVDFNSLYPSIMQQYNLCFSTFIKQVEPGFTHFEKQTDIGTFKFRQDIPGILPEILTHLLDARSRTKKEMAISTNVSIKNILNARQLCLKLCANSIYGFCGAPTNTNYCLAPLAATVTGVGRELIESSKITICNELKELNVTAVAGDTDSLFLHFPTLQPTKEDNIKCFEYAKKAADLVSHGFLFLDVEKIMNETFLFCKKRYGALIIEDIGKPGKVSTKGGIDVKRNYATFISKMYADCFHSLILRKITTEDELLSKVKTYFDDFIMDKINIEDLAITIKLGKNYANDGEKLIQQVVANKIEKRKGTGPKCGDRIEYVILHVQGKTAIAEKAEDLGYVKDHPELCEIDKPNYLERVKQQIIELFRFRFKSVLKIEMYFSEIQGIMIRHLNKNQKLTDLLPKIANGKNLKRVIGSVINNKSNVATQPKLQWRK